MFKRITDKRYEYEGNIVTYVLEYAYFGTYYEGEGWRLRTMESGAVNILAIFVTKDDGHKYYLNPLCKDCRSWSFDDIINKAEKIVNNYEHM